MSQFRHSGGTVVDSLLGGSGGGFTAHDHPTHQLTWAVEGSFAVGAQGTTWLVTAHVALWLPAGVEHEVAARHRARMRSLYFQPETCPLPWRSVTAVSTGGLVGALLQHLIKAPRGPARQRAEHVLFDVVAPVPQVVVSVPTITDDRVRRIGAALSADPSDTRTLDEWGRAVGASGRTLARVIRRETGLGFSQWRNQIRVAHAARRLANGAPVADVAHEVGFATPSAFVQCFRKIVGQTPGSYSASARRAAPVERPPGIAVTIVEPGLTIDPTAAPYDP